MEVIVEDKQLSLAIGKKGQNVRLAAKLTGWKIDIKSEEEKRREVEKQFGELESGAAAAVRDGRKKAWLRRRRRTEPAWTPTRRRRRSMTQSRQATRHPRPPKNRRRKQSKSNGTS